MSGEILKDENGHPVYRIAWDAQKHVIHFTVFYVNSFDFETAEVLDEEQTVKVEVNWDGCSNWDYCEEVQQHFCGVHNLRQYQSLQLYLYAKAAELLTSLGSTYPAENMDDFVP